MPGIPSIAIDAIVRAFCFARRADAVVTRNTGHFAGTSSLESALATRLASREFIESRARLFDRNEFERALNEIPDVEAEDHDRV